MPSEPSGSDAGGGPASSPGAAVRRVLTVVIVTLLCAGCGTATSGLSKGRATGAPTGYQMATGVYPAIKAVGTTRVWTVEPCGVVAESTGGLCPQEDVDGAGGILLTVPGRTRLAGWVKPIRLTSSENAIVAPAGGPSAQPSELPEIGHAVALTRRGGGWWLPVTGHDQNGYRVLLRPVDGVGRPMGGLVYTFWFYPH